MFSLSQLVRGLLKDEFELVSQSSEVSVEIDQLLYFEPYTCFSAEILRELVDKFENSPDKCVPEAFPIELNKTKSDQLKQVLSIDSAKLQAALARAPTIPPRPS